MSTDFRPQDRFLVKANYINCLICGRVGSGKSTIIRDLLMKTTSDGKQFLQYTKVFIFALQHSFNSPCYKELAEFFENANVELRKKKILEENESMYTFVPIIPSDEDGTGKVLDQGIIPISKLPLKENDHCVCVFDDVLCLEKREQRKIESYFISGRHKGIDNFYLSQSYFETPRKQIRLQSNMQIMFKQPTNAITALYNEFGSLDMTPEEFFQFFRENTEDLHDFVVIIDDGETRPFNGRYRRGFYISYCPKHYLLSRPVEEPSSKPKAPIPSRFRYP